MRGLSRIIALATAALLYGQALSAPIITVMPGTANDIIITDIGDVKPDGLRMVLADIHSNESLVCYHPRLNLGIIDCSKKHWLAFQSKWNTLFRCEAGVNERTARTRVDHGMGFDNASRQVDCFSVYFQNHWNLERRKVGQGCTSQDGSRLVRL